MTVGRHRFELEGSDGGPLRGDVRLPDAVAADAAIVVCHGFKGFKDWGFFPYIAERLAERVRLPVVTFNFSGAGVGPDLETFSELDRFEANTFTRELDDLARVIDAASAARLPGLDGAARFGLLGHSRGGGVAVLAASEDDRVASLVTWAAVCTVDRWSDDQKAEWRERGRLDVRNTRTGQILPLGIGLLQDVEANAERLDILRAAAELRIPYLIVHGGDDESVSPDEGAALARAAADDRVWFERIAGAGHTFGAVHPFQGPTEHLTRALDLSADWFGRYPGAGSD